MSSRPGLYNMLVQRRADDRTRLEFLDSNGDPLDLTDWAIYAQVWDKKRTEKYADFTVGYIDRQGGVVDLILYAMDTEDLPCECFYDVMLEDPSNFKEYYLEGAIYVSEGYSEP